MEDIIPETVPGRCFTAIAILEGMSIALIIIDALVKSPIADPMGA